MTKILIEEATVKLALEALESERPYLGPMPSKTVKAITACQQALAQPAVPLTDLGTLQAIVDEYYAWIRHHAAGHDYDDFLRNRGITASPEKGQQ
jgi:hypothetical protein